MSRIQPTTVTTQAVSMGAAQPDFTAKFDDGLGVVVRTNVADLDLDTPAAVAAAAATLLTGAATLTALAHRFGEEQADLDLADAPHLPGCNGVGGPGHDVCAAEAVKLPVPDRLSLPGGGLLEVQLERWRDPQQPTDVLSVYAGGNGTILGPGEAEQFADQLVTFAAQVRLMGRQVTAAYQAADRP